MPDNQPIIITPLSHLPPMFAADAIFAVIEDALPDSWNLNTLKDLLAREHSFGFAAMDGVDLIGFIAGHIVANEAEILSFGVLQKYQRQGIGEDLLNHFMDHAKKEGVGRILLDVAEDNATAIQLYQKYQFEVYGVRERYYHRAGKGRVNAILMALSFAK